ncbi:MAG: hypothetical protein GY839_21040 [candidate division Zixibacteria bacterium]|nr:hypothetical protein [candidate division Zixibacteria bacterium]
MKKAIISALLLFILTFQTTDSLAEIGFESGLGFPSGYMDISYDAFGYERIPLFNKGDIEIKLAGSFAAKGDGNNGQLFTALASSYILGRYEVENYFDNLKPFISPGAGLHIIRSWANKKSPLNDLPMWTITTKAHMFYGMEFRFAGKAYLIFQGRVTYPGDILFDLWFLGLGARL